MMEKLIYHALEDPTYARPVIDEKEERVRTLMDGQKIPFLYIHGSFEGTEVKFVFCFPRKDAYRGRFFQYLSPFPGPDEEVASLEHRGLQDNVSFALLHGAYFVETNMGSSAMFAGRPDSTIVYKSSAAAAEYSRQVAMELYGCPRPYGYVFGGSGGGYKTMACIENTNAWDGACPYVIGSPVSLPNTITMHAQGQRVLRHAFSKIVDALDAGGSGAPYKDLTHDEAQMLRELTRMGFPPRAWFLEAEGRIDPGSLPVLLPGMKQADPSYFTDFWTLPGYEGADGLCGAATDRVRFEGVIKSVHLPEKEDADKTGFNGVDDAWKKLLASGNSAYLELESVPEHSDYVEGVNITILSGEAQGKVLKLDHDEENRLYLGMCFGVDDIAAVLALIQPGDRVALDNSDFIAIQSYYRHQVPADPAFHAWDQFRDAEGQPTLPQRRNVFGYSMTGTGTVQDGQIQGKVIVIQSLMDESTCPWCADWYRGKIAEALGSDSHMRVWYMDRCLHGDDGIQRNTQVVNYLGALHQALLDVSDWVERGVEPLPTTNYRLEDGQIVVPDSARERRGIQPVPVLLVNGAVCTHVKVGEIVTLTASAQAPEQAGKITALDFDFGDRSQEDFFDVVGVLNHDSASVTHTYAKPGTYFAAVRVKMQRKGDSDALFTQVLNLARARVIVEE